MTEDQYIKEAIEAFKGNYGFLYKLVERMGYTREVNWGEHAEDFLETKLREAYKRGQAECCIHCNCYECQQKNKLTEYNRQLNYSSSKREQENKS